MTMKKKKLTSAPATGCRRKRSNRSCLTGAEQRVVRCERPKLKMDVWQTSRPGNKFPVVCKLKNRRWHIVRVGHAWEHWQSAAKEGRQLTAQASNVESGRPLGEEDNAEA